MDTTLKIGMKVCLTDEGQKALGKNKHGWIVWVAPTQGIVGVMPLRSRYAKSHHARFWKLCTCQPMRKLRRFRLTA